MNLTDDLPRRIADTSLTKNERAQLRVQLSRSLEEAGDYEGARTAMGELWSRVGERPMLEGLDRATAAEVLLQAGALTSCIGSAKQIEGAQEIAKDLISESIRIFESLGDAKNVVRAQVHLACCYWRLGSYDDARVTLRDARSRLTDEDAELKAIVLFRSALIESVTMRLNDALRLHIEAAPLFEQVANPALKGKFHNELAIVLELLGVAERRPDYIDRALVEYAAASYHFEQAGHERFWGRVENNLGMLFSTVGKFDEAHEHVNRARAIFAKLKDTGSIAQVDETRARVLLAEGRHAEAEQVARSAVRTLEQGDEQTLLAEALTTQGVALARLGQYEEAQRALERAIDSAEQAGDRDGAGQAALTIIEELSGQMPLAELRAVSQRAAELLAGLQHPGIKDRLLACAMRLLEASPTEAGGAEPSAAAGAERSEALEERSEEFKAPATWEGFSFREAVRRYERFFIELALKEAGGVVSRAAQLLGLKHHQSLISLLNRRHKDLLRERSPLVPRRRSIITIDKEELRSHGDAAREGTRPIMILHVEDDEMMASAVKETLELEGWRVIVCAEGRTALRKIASAAHYDLLIFDYTLPGVSGVELVRQARKLSHRRRTPIIVFSASEVEAEAWRAGADAFLRKPDDVGLLVNTVRRLLAGETDEA